MSEPVQHISVSQIQMLEGCPEQHRLKYVKGLAQTFSHEALIGQAVHKLPEFCMKAIQQGRPMPTRAEAIDEIAKYWEEHQDDPTISFLYRGSGYPVNKEKALGSASQMGRVMYDELLGIVSKGTWGSEFEFDSPIPSCEGWTFRGVIDHVRRIPVEFDVPLVGTDPRQTVIMLDDWKTTGKMWTQDKADQSMQATAYCWAIHQLTGIYPRSVTFHVFTRPTSKNHVAWKSFETKRKIAVVKKFEATLKWAVKLATSHKEDQPSEKRTDWEYHKYCPYREGCTPWEFSQTDPVSIV